MKEGITEQSMGMIINLLDSMNEKQLYEIHKSVKIRIDNLSDY